MLPLGGAIVGVVALLLGAYAALSLPKIKTELATHDDKLSHLDDIASQASAAATAAASANSRIDAVAKGTNDAFASVSTELGNQKAEIAKIEDMMKSHAVARGAKGGGGAPAVAGPGEYIVKSGDTGHKIARANGVSVEDLISVNPGVNWSHLKVGQKLKLPEKKT